LAILSTVSSFVSFGYLVRSSQQPNKALQLTANPLRGLSAPELGRSGGRAAFKDFVL
jgi:hypothetical protein